MSDVDFRGLSEKQLPVFNALVNSLFDEDYDLFLQHHPPAAKDQFEQAVAILKPLGKPLKLEYLSHIVKIDSIKMLCKVTYSDTVEELLWDFNLVPEGGGYKLVSMGFDK